jgi:hypothetical protein
MEQTLSALQQRVNQFRTQKEVLKAQYTAAQAEAGVNATAEGKAAAFFLDLGFDATTDETIIGPLGKHKVDIAVCTKRVGIQARIFACSVSDLRWPIGL